MTQRYRKLIASIGMAGALAAAAVPAAMAKNGADDPVGHATTWATTTAASFRPPGADDPQTTTWATTAGRPSTSPRCVTATTTTGITNTRATRDPGTTGTTTRRRPLRRIQTADLRTADAYSS